MTANNHTRSAYDEILELATTVFESRELAEAWMHEPLLALGKQTPVSRLMNDRDLVKAVLRKIDTGEFS